jgi:glycosyltransferase involved in cell wall biosynthesis
MSESWPFVSVVIPMRNEAAHVAACLEAVLAQEYPRERIEVIVVDGESDDATPAIVRATSQRDGRVRLLSNPGRIVPTAMNIGIRAARGEIITRIDGHTRIAPDYVRVGVETLRRTGADNVGGPMRAVGGGRFGDAVATATSSRFGIGSYFHFGTAERVVDTVYMGMWPRRVFERVGLFDEELVRNQDDELSYRIRKEGGRIVLTPAMNSWYQNRQSLRHLARQYFQYGLWKIRVLQKHPRQMSWRHFVPPAFVAVLILLAVLSPAVPAAGASLGALACIYSGAVLAISAAHSLRRGVATWLATALAFVAIHLSWGAGFLVGLFKFAGRWWRPEPQPSTLNGGGSHGGALAGGPGESFLKASRGGHR